MKLLTLHRILVSTAIVFSVYFLVQQVLTWRRTGGPEIWFAIAAGVVALALAWYLVNLKRFVRIEPPAGRREP